MRTIYNPSIATWPLITERPVIDNAQLLKNVRKILDDVRRGGDRALRKYSKKFDGLAPKKMRLGQKDIKKASSFLEPALKDAIKMAINNITAFHTKQVETSVPVETMQGVTCWRKSVGIPRVGIYIPGGSAPLFSTVLMLGIPASIAGCREVALFTPPSKDGSIHPAILYAAEQVGITEIYACGGAQAIGAMAYGTSTISKVDKIFGPGNQYVTAAKQLVQLDGTAIDMPAGPSEVCILADESADPEFVAADLLSQAEHGIDSQVLLVTTSRSLLENVLEQLEVQVQKLSRTSIAKAALENSRGVFFDSIDDALTLVNAYAPEHLIIASSSAEQFSDRIINAGSVFLGNWTPESAGDYASGTNHTLPTNGFARAYSGVSVDSFIKKITFQRITELGIKNIGSSIIMMANAEGLDAHARAVSIRLNKM